MLKNRILANLLIISAYLVFLKAEGGTGKNQFFIGGENHQKRELKDVLQQEGSSYTVTEKIFNDFTSYKIGYRTNLIKWYLFYANISCNTDTSMIYGGGIGLNLTQIGLWGIFPKIYYN